MDQTILSMAQSLQTATSSSSNGSGSQLNNNNNNNKKLNNNEHLKIEYPPISYLNSSNNNGNGLSSTSSSSSSSSSYTLPKNLMLTRGFSKVQANEEILNETRTQIESNLCRNLNELPAITSTSMNNMQTTNTSTTTKTTTTTTTTTTSISNLDKSNQDLAFLKVLNNELTCYSFMLPNLNKIEDYKFKEYLQNDLIELPTQYNLNESGHLNWWTQTDWENVCRHLYPMVTSGDGNCLLHAASLAMWGLHDRYLILRKALHSTLKQIKEDNTSPLYRRWKWEQMCQNRKYGLIYNDDEWSKEWQSLLKLSSYQPRVSNQTSSNTTKVSTTTNNNNNGSSGSSSPTIHHNNYLTSTTRTTQPLPLNTESFPTNHSSSSLSSSSSLNKSNKTASYSNLNGQQQQQQQQPNNLSLVGQDGTVYFESLEEFHVFLLAHILQRPIIIVSDTMLHDLNGDPLSPIPFGGIYLPFECDINQCHRYPLVLAYDSAHFSALVLMDEYDDDFADDNDTENYPHQQNPSSQDNLLTNEEIHFINKKLQTKPPYAIIPITYSNKELLTIHFAHDPGRDYDWSKFPMQQQQQQQQEQSQQTNTNLKQQTKTSNSNGSTTSSSHSSNDNMSVSSLNNNNNNMNNKQQLNNILNGNNKSNSNQNAAVDFPNMDDMDSLIELKRDEKMFLLQRYLDIVKLELFDPGPLSKRNNQNQAINSSGMCVSIVNVSVPEPLNNNNTSFKNGLANGVAGIAEKQKSLKLNAKLSVNNKIQKFLNLFKRQNESTNSGGGGGSGAGSNTNFKIKSNNKQQVSATMSTQLPPVATAAATTPTVTSSSSLLTSTGSKLRKSLRNSSLFNSSSQDHSQSNHQSISTNPNAQTTQSSNNKTDQMNKSSSSKSTTLPSKLTTKPILTSSSTNSTQLINRTNNVFHKLVTFKSWNSMFDSMTHHTCLLGVKLNLAKPPKFNKIIFNYIESAQQKFEILKQQQRAQLIQQQQQQQQHQQQQQQRLNNNGGYYSNETSTNTRNIINLNNQNSRSTRKLDTSPQIQALSVLASAPPSIDPSTSHNNNNHHYCLANRADCLPNDLCNYCFNNKQKNRSSNQNQAPPPSYNHYQYYSNPNTNNNNNNTLSSKEINNYYDQMYEDEITSFHHV